ncbi:glucose-6-phosphate dehydrogenase [Couchioplanes azureus]|uniref:glucose-6-phosphate dehydrogenase n=1 Tax=Couchioplanes caeruleus TaxID=56438 RepID=UPI0016702A8F|nr:glucose-6-phosphate dehydrogenase [Couchioplanes caeruleus]GGQ86271.1 glucose-6-phosphate 1-dehydrogenase [Couchioplanes caeruleus subsp. azureus]
MTGTLLAPSDTTARTAHALPTAIVMFGASGDLARRELFPALINLFRQGRLPEQSLVIGVGRSPLDDETLRERIRGWLPSAESQWLGRIRYLRGGYDDPATYAGLATMLADHASQLPVPADRLYYLSTPAQAFEPVIGHLAAAGLNRAVAGGHTRIVIEKPFGQDETSAQRLDAVLHRAFDESQVYRIDHYLGKDAVQNILTLRFANAAFQPMWHRSWVDNVQITVSETVGVNDRGGFYETAGAARDMLQNHVLQLLALTMMEPPASLSSEAIRDEKVRLLEAVRLAGPAELDRLCVRGQYGPAPEGSTTPGYLQEPNVDPASRTETYAALRLEVDNPRWSGVPVYVRTGKCLPRRMAEVVLQLRRPQHLPFAFGHVLDDAPEALVLRIQPDPGLRLRFAAKRPGHQLSSQPAEMTFSYPAQTQAGVPQAYERLLHDALVGDPSLFVRSDEVRQSWRIVDPVVRSWAASSTPVPSYPAGSWGPVEADRLLTREGRRWHDDR